LDSYINSTRLVVESSHELEVLRTLGAKKTHIFILVLTYVLAISFFGSIFGISLGIVGSQVVSTIFRWLLTSFSVSPFIKVEQALQAITLTVFFSTVGCFYPAYRATKVV